MTLFCSVVIYRLRTVRLYGAQTARNIEMEEKESFWSYLGIIMIAVPLFAVYGISTCYEDATDSIDDPLQVLSCRTWPTSNIISFERRYGGQGNTIQIKFDFRETSKSYYIDDIAEFNAAKTVEFTVYPSSNSTFKITDERKQHQFVVTHIGRDWKYQFEDNRSYYLIAMTVTCLETNESVRTIWHDEYILNVNVQDEDPSSYLASFEGMHTPTKGKRRNRAEYNANSGEAGRSFQIIALLFITIILFWLIVIKILWAGIIKPLFKPADSGNPLVKFIVYALVIYATWVLMRDFVL